MVVKLKSKKAWGKASPATKKQAQFAKNAKKFKH